MTVTRLASMDGHDRRRLTWVSLTRHGRQASTDHLTALTRIADGDLEP